MARIDVAELRGVTLTPAGTTQADAQPFHRQHALCPSATQNAGVIMVEQFAQSVVWGTVFNGSTVDFKIYPWSGAAFNGQTANLHVTIAPGKGVMWTYLNSTTIGLIY